MDDSLAILNQSQHPWAPLPGESAKAFEAFRIYRDMPPVKRNTHALLIHLLRLRDNEDFTPPATREETLRGWRDDYRWDERALSWDVELDKIWRDEKSAAVKEAARRQVYEAQMLQEVGMAALGEVSTVELSENPQEVRRYITEGADMERTILGMDKKKEDSGPTIYNPIMIVRMAEEMEERLKNSNIIEGEIRELSQGE